MCGLYGFTTNKEKSLDKEQKETFKLIFDTIWEKLSYTIKKKILKDFSKQVSIIQGVLS